MVRNYKKKETRSGSVDEEAMNLAIKEVLEGKLSFRKSAKKYNLKPSTLESRIKKIRQVTSAGEDEGPPRTFRSKYSSYQVFAVEEESLLNKYIIDCCKMHYGLTCVHVRKLAYEFAKANNLKYPSKWNENLIAGIDWLEGFRKRNPNLSLRKPENTSAARSLGFNKSAVNEFYENLEKLYERYKFTGDRIYNFDESGISTVMSTPRVLADKKQKQVGQFVSRERGELVTFGGFISANGNTIPPLFIFPRVHFKDHFMEGAPEGSLGVATRSGWINCEIFVEVLKHIQKFTLSSKENPILLLCDNHESHVTLGAINYARDNGIVYLSFPPHTTHRLQPLDVGVFGPFKSKLKTAFNDWHVSNPGKTTMIHNIPRIAKIAYFESFTAKNITNAFAKPGLWPFNKLAFSDDDFTAVQVYQDLQSQPMIPVENSFNQQHVEECAVQSSPQSPSILPPTQLIDEAGPSQSSQMPNATPIRPSTSKSITTPEMIRPYPKHKRQQQTQPRKGRQPGKSRIYTDSPEKVRLQELQKSKEQKSIEIENRKKAREMKRTLNLSTEKELKIPKRNKKIEETDSSDSDTVLSYRESSASPSSQDIEGSEQPRYESPIEIDPDNMKDGTFILVKFANKTSVVYYVGQIISHYSNIEFKVSFLRKKPGFWSFVFPNIKDEGTVCMSDVILILPKPKSAVTARTADIFSFYKDLTAFNVQ